MATFWARPICWNKLFGNSNLQKSNRHQTNEIYMLPIRMVDFKTQKKSKLNYVVFITAFLLQFLSFHHRRRHLISREIKFYEICPQNAWITGRPETTNRLQQQQFCNTNGNCESIHCRMPKQNNDTEMFTHHCQILGPANMLTKCSGNSRLPETRSPSTITIYLAKSKRAVRIFVCVLFAKFAVFLSPT